MTYYFHLDVVLWLFHQLDISANPFTFFYEVKGT